MRVRELSADCLGCGGSLDDAPAIESALRDGAARIGAAVLDSCVTRYKPIGTTVFLPLAESHAMVTTWPEHRYAVVSVLLCNEAMEPRAVLDAVLACLRPERVRCREVEHDAVGSAVEAASR